METISSAANPLVRRLRLLLADRRHRRREGAFVVEGIQPTWRAVEAGWDVETLVVCPALLGDSPARSMINDCGARGIRVAHFSRELFGRLSERDGPSGLAAIVRTRDTDLERVAPATGDVVVALHRVANPGNLGTIVRTADAAGAAAVVLVGDTADPYAPAAVKAAMGSLFAVPVVRSPTIEHFSAWAAGHGVTVVATSGYAERDHWSVDYPTPLAVLLGNEGEGLPRSVIDGADLRVRIPMVGTAESLNLSVAAGVLLYEVRRHAVG